MAQKEHTLIKFAFVLFYILPIGCIQPKENKIVPNFEKVDISQIPNDTVLQISSALVLGNGIYYLDGNPYSGFIKYVYKSDTLKSIGSYLNGKQQGITVTFFPNGKIETIRKYKIGLGYGQHLGYWGNENKKFDFQYLNDKREGIQKQWYESGKPYFELNFSDDRENGMQKAWRENGKIYINYEVKDGVRYGLQKAVLCYTLKNGELK
jgi:antitoxin component YwqK of YwqJK toxin-antitoxin module